MWNVNAGIVVMVNDLLVINLGAPGSEPSAQARVHLSVYDVAYSPVGSGRVAFFRDGTSADEALVRGVTLTDSPELARFVLQRVQSAGWTGVDISIPPRAATFRRSPLSDGLQVGITAKRLEIEATWDALGTPRWSDGVSKNYPLEHAWAFFVEVARATVAVNGQKLKPKPYRDERFRPMFGQPISSCMVGLAEVHLRPKR